MPQIFEPIVYSVDRDRVTQARLAHALSAENIGFRAFECAESFLGSGLDSLSAAGMEARAACLVLEVDLPAMSGLQLQAVLAERGQRMPIIFLSATADVRAPIRALQAGAADFLLKPMEPAQLTAAVSAALEHSRRIALAEIRRAQILARIANLTQRELEVMDYVVRGHTSKEIAQALCISPRTVEVHRKNVFGKMHASSVATLVEQVIRVRDEREAGVQPSQVEFAHLRDSTYLTRAGNV